MNAKKNRSPANLDSIDFQIEETELDYREAAGRLPEADYLITAVSR